MRGALDSQLVADPVPASLALNDPADPALVPFGNARRDRNSEATDTPAFGALSVKKLLNREDRIYAWTVCALHQCPTIGFVQWKISWLEVIKDPAVDYVIRRFEIFAAANMNWG